MRRLAILFLAGLSAAYLTGCGTVCNLWSWHDRKFSNVACREVYGGVTQDARGAASSLGEAFRPDARDSAVVNAANSVTDLTMACLLLVDLPISFAADTLTLPLTIPEALGRASAPRVRREPQVPTPPQSSADQH